MAYQHVRRVYTPCESRTCWCSALPDIFQVIHTRQITIIHEIVWTIITMIFPMCLSCPCRVVTCNGITFLERLTRLSAECTLLVSLVWVSCLSRNHHRLLYPLTQMTMYQRKQIHSLRTTTKIYLSIPSIQYAITPPWIGSLAQHSFRRSGHWDPTVKRLNRCCFNLSCAFFELELSEDEWCCGKIFLITNMFRSVKVCDALVGRSFVSLTCSTTRANHQPVSLKHHLKVLRRSPR